MSSEEKSGTVFEQNVNERVGSVCVEEANIDLVNSCV